MTLVAGIDLSTKALDVVTVAYDDDHDRPRWTHVPLTEQDPAGLAWFYVCRRVIPRFNHWVDLEDVAIVALEQPVGPGRGKLLPLFGALIAAIPKQISVTYLPPQEWRKTWLGHGNASKADAKNAAVLMGVAGDWAEDAYEAYGIALAARELNRQGVARSAA